MWYVAVNKETDFYVTKASGSMNIDNCYVIQTDVLPDEIDVIKINFYKLITEVQQIEKTVPVYGTDGLETYDETGNLITETITIDKTVYSWKFDEEAYNNRPRAEPKKTTEEKLEEMDTSITDLQKMYFELLMEV